MVADPTHAAIAAALRSIADALEQHRPVVTRSDDHRPLRALVDELGLEMKPFERGLRARELDSVRIGRVVCVRPSEFNRFVDLLAERERSRRVTRGEPASLGSSYDALVAQAEASGRRRSKRRAA